MAEPDIIQPALVLGVLGIFIAATGVISLAFHNLGRGLRDEVRQMDTRLRDDITRLENTLIRHQHDDGLPFVRSSPGDND